MSTFADLTAAIDELAQTISIAGQGNDAVTIAVAATELAEVNAQLKALSLVAGAVSDGETPPVITGKVAPPPTPTSSGK